ncbi:MAG: hypothetical protein AAFN79_07965 [Pseudomonadota bacterium]
MKGGIASGVVYGAAINVLARRYRFRSIAGTSAGAIAAVVVAAAEYRRRRAIAAGADDVMEGFAEVARKNEELAQGIEDLFEAEPRYSGLLAGLIATTKAPPGAGFVAKFIRFFGAFAGAWEASVALIAVFSAAFAFRGGLTMLGAFCLLVAVIAPVFVALIRFLLLITSLNRFDYGMCSGLGSPGIANWIHNAVQDVAGKPRSQPLTVGELWGPAQNAGDPAEPGINLVTMTTDLSSSRPYRTPLGREHHFFTRTEMERLFPPEIVNHLVEKSEDRDDPWIPTLTSSDGRRIGAIEVTGDLALYRMPSVADFPVAISARLSLSFPFLFATVPLWRVDAGWRENAPPTASSGDAIVATRRNETLVVRRCLLSDGGISSNFPIHFFDSFLPQRPTFGIMLTEWSADHDRPDERVEIYDIDSEEHCDFGAPPHDRIRVRPIGGLLSFIMRIVDTAKDWRDQSQSRLPGNADRIVTIKLTDREGGYNLAMDQETLKFMNGLGKQAGEALVRAFETDEGRRFDDHRFMRALSFLQEFKERAASMQTALDAAPTRPGGRGYADLLTSYSDSCFSNNLLWRTEVADYVEAIAALGANAPPLSEGDQTLTPEEKMTFIRQRASLRVSAEAQTTAWPPPRAAAARRGSDGSS